MITFLRISLVAALALGWAACSSSDFAGDSGIAKSGNDKGKDGKDSDDADDGDDGEADDAGEDGLADIDGDDATDAGGIDSDGGQDSGGTDVDSDGAGVDGQLGEDGEIAGVEVTKVGVNFEDVRASAGETDKDYNDAVLCFEGKFKVDQSNVVSIADQTVFATTSSLSGCNHNIRVIIKHKDGKTEPPITYDSRAAKPIELKFRFGSRLEVYMTPYAGDAKCQFGVERNMHAAEDALVKPDVCNTAGE